MFKFFRKPKWTAIPANDIHAGDVVRFGLIQGEVLFVSKITIQNHPYVNLIVDMTTPGFPEQNGTMNVLSTTLISVIR